MLAQCVHRLLQRIALGLQRLKIGIGQGAGLGSAGFQQHQFGAGVGGGGAQLGARADRGDGLHQAFQHIAGIPQGFQRLFLPFRRIAAAQVGDQQRHVDHHIAVEQSGAEFHVAGVSGAGIFVRFFEVVDYGEVIHFRR